MITKFNAISFKQNNEPKPMPDKAFKVFKEADPMTQKAFNHANADPRFRNKMEEEVYSKPGETVAMMNILTALNKANIEIQKSKLDNPQEKQPPLREALVAKMVIEPEMNKVVYNKRIELDKANAEKTKLEKLKKLEQKAKEQQIKIAEMQKNKAEKAYNISIEKNLEKTLNNSDERQLFENKLNASLNQPAVEKTIGEASPINPEKDLLEKQFNLPDYKKD